MLLRVGLFLMMAIGIVGAGMTAWIVFQPPPAAVVAVQPAEPPAAKSVIIVAARALRAGSLMKPEDLAAREMAAADVPAGASRDTPQIRGGLNGAMIRRSLGEGQPILPADVVHPGDHGFLAAVLGPNMRAITVAVDVVSGTAGLLWAGDRVDLILTQTLDDPLLTAGRRVAAETVLSDARVIAIDQQMVHGQAPDGSVAPANRTATLEVTPPQAERVLVAGRLGQLSLSVLSADRHNDQGTATDADLPWASQTPSPLAQAAPAAAGRGQGKADTGKADTGKADTGKADTGKADTGKADTGKADTGKADTGTADTGKTANAKPYAGVTWASDVSPALGDREVRTPPAMVHIFQGGSDSKEFHF